MWRRQTQKFILGVFALVLFSMPSVAAQTSSSPSYKVDEYQFGTGGNPDLNSSSYNANASVGSLGVGRSASTNYNMEAGFITPSEPFLELFINTASVDLGTLDSGATATGTSVFWVRSYLSSAYVVQTMSPSLTSEGGHVIPGKSTRGVPQLGKEEFGINLVANSSPAIGSNPFNVPDNTFADGTVDSEYGQPNEFKYGQGDIIARAPATAGKQATGRTDYTVSYIANISNITPAGSYRMVHDIVVTGTY